MKIFKHKYFRIFAFLLVFTFTFILRAHNYDKIPFSGHLEEHLYAWSGVYLIETGVPVSWSTLDYPKEATIYKGRVDYRGGEPMVYVDLQRPWLDEPPLFSLLVGWFAHINNAIKEDVLPSAFIREPLIYIGTLSALMVFVIVRFLSGFWMGVLSMLMYGTIPIFVFSSRMAVPENLIALFLLVIIYLLLKFQINPKYYYILPIPLLAGIAGLSKPTGYFLLPLAIFLVFSQAFTKKYEKINLSYAIKLCAYMILAMVPFVIAFILYGIYFNADIFWRIVSIQGFRPVGFSSLAWFFISPAYDIFPLTESWYVFSLLSLAYFLFVPFKNSKDIVIFSTVYWILIVMLSGGEGDLLPWYRYPLFPLLSIICTWGIRLLIEKANFYTTFLSAGLLLGTRSLLVNAFRSNVSPTEYRVWISFLMFPSLIKILFDNAFLDKICKIIIVLVMIVGIYFNSFYIYNRFEIFCEHISCPITESNWLSTLHFPFIWRFFTLHNYPFIKPS